MYLIRQLKKNGEITRDMIPNLNSGGCAVYAAAVGKRLKELGLEVWAIYGEGYFHFKIQFKYNGRIYTHDSDSTERVSTLPRYYEKMSIEKCASEAANPSLWNSYFDRRTGIPVIKDNVKTLLSDSALGIG